MTNPDRLNIYRKRFFPPECILLKDDIIIQQNEEVIITKWNTLKPKSTFSHGSSCYYLKKGFKVSKYYRPDGSLLYYYCDIVEYTYDENSNSLTVTDLMADVIVYPDGRLKVVDLDELADAFRHELITATQLSNALHQLNDLLSLIYRDKLDLLLAPLDMLV